MKILDFKTVSPLFEMERDGEKPFTITRIEKGDERQRSLSQWQPSWNWAVRITNPGTGESFVRRIVAVDFFRYFTFEPELSLLERLHVLYDWRVIIMGTLETL